jgi:hypothetical protein
MARNRNIPVSTKIKRELSQLPEGEVFEYRKFVSEESSDTAVVKALGRLVSNGVLERLAKGKYFKPRKTPFGNLRPSESAVIDILTKQNNCTVGYVTGTGLYNRMGLTTQVPQVITIARPTRLLAKILGGYRIKFAIRSFRFVQKDIPLLQLLDALKDIQRIPDASPDEVLSKLIKAVSTLSEQDRVQILSLAMNYNAATRALLGAILETHYPDANLSALSKSINQLSRYKIRISEKYLPNKANWNTL